MAKKEVAPAVQPEFRRLWVYAIDPWAETSLATASVSRSVLPVRWEPLQLGPIGEYVEVVDVDPSSNCVYDPVNLEQPQIIAGDGLIPSEGSPQFHQQMVYAVVMKTIGNFERALGRPILWSPRRGTEGGVSPKRKWEYVPRLRLYPHALREANAYYSPGKKAILFGYFTASTGDSLEDLPGGMVFTCLSHDVIAHETTHAILDGIHSRLLEPTNLDMLAFHEAFADIVAIFQHFTLPGLVLDQMRRTRGDLGLDSLLATLAVQVGRATEYRRALRNALGRFDTRGRRLPPDPAELSRATECHARGAILVAAVFDAFLGIYTDRVQDLRRIATGGTGILPRGDVHPDLAQRFADEAVKAAQRVLTICIRALDYLPPVDITFGDYLRALITADANLVPDDPRRYRVAFIEAFRKRGIFPFDVRAMGEDTLRWRGMTPQEWKRVEAFFPSPEVFRTMVATWEFSPDLKLKDETAARSLATKFRKCPEELQRLFLDACWCKQGRSAKKTPLPNGLDSQRDQRRRNLYDISRQFSRFLYSWLAVATWNASRRQLKNGLYLLGLDFRLFREYLKNPRKRDGAIEVHDTRPTFRVYPDGRTKVELLVILTQRRMQKLQTEDGKPILGANGKPVEYRLRGGCTLLIDPEKGCIRYAIAKRINSERRRQWIEQFFRGQIADLGDAAFDQFRLRPGAERHVEPLAILHRTFDSGAC
jgi:hypothetical protein